MESVGLGEVPGRGTPTRMPARGHVAVLSGLLVVAVVAVYSPVRNHEFVGYDDIPYIVENPTITDGLSASGLRRTLTRPEHANWIPLTTLSLQLNHAVHGLDPAGYLLTNVAIHAATSVLLFLLLIALTGAVWRSVFVAAVFALHPLHVESVAWASERKDVLCAFFFVLSIFAYLRFVQHRTLPNYALLLWCGVAALLAKPMAVTLPFVLLLLDYWPLRRLQPDPTRAWPDVRILAGAVIEKLPLFVLVGAAAVVTFTVQGEGGNFSYTSDLPPGVRLATVSHAYVAYLADSVWPSSLAAIYPIPIEAPPLWRTIAEMASLLALTVLTLFAAPRRPYLVVGWLWFIGMLVPVVGWVHVGMQARADRYMYLPQVGLAIAVTWGVSEILASHRNGRRLAAEASGDTLESSRARTSSWAAALVAAAATIVLTALALCSWRQVGYWRDSITLFRRAVDTTRDNALARYNLGTALGQAGRIEEAVAQQEEAHRIMLRAEAARMRRAGED